MQQNNFMKKFSIAITAVGLTMAWVVVPRSQAETTAPEKACDSVPAPAQECDSAPAPAIAQAETQPVATKSVVVQEAQKSSSQPAQDSSVAKNDKKVVLSKRCREMDDSEMDGLNAGITGSFDITGNGNQNMTDNSVQSINLSDQAQQNLSSLVNILSINSTISVMLNLNVNINSTVGTVNQGNTGTQTGPP
ncbi:MAG: hypothetical protein WCS70_01975 [Verrucomicrobiota bacterium]